MPELSLLSTKSLCCQQKGASKKGQAANSSSLTDTLLHHLLLDEIPKLDIAAVHNDRTRKIRIQASRSKLVSRISSALLQSRCKRFPANVQLQYQQSPGIP
jgi:hypothetical protein